MLKESFLEVFERDLLKLKEEVGLYSNEETLWIVREEISNSAGNLCLHLIGNLNHFIGAVLGHTGYVRNRENEFTLRHTSRKDLLVMLDAT